MGLTLREGQKMVHAVSKLALRGGASVTLDLNGNIFLCRQALSRQTIIACCPYG
ncbi:MAG: hypothetical protein IID17_01005 [Nitrospinae bacterium]|nr:hypothetical protein [Nitrospinota bacterium]